MSLEERFDSLTRGGDRLERAVERLLRGSGRQRHRKVGCRFERNAEKSVERVGRNRRLVCGWMPRETERSALKLTASVSPGRPLPEIGLAPALSHRHLPGS